MKSTRTLWAAAYIAGGLFTVLFLFLAALRLFYPYEVEWNEGAVLIHALRVLEGKPIYAMPSLDFSAFVYTPLYYYLTACVMKVAGIGLWAGRLVSIVATFLTAFLCANIVRREARSFPLAVLSAALYLAFYRTSGYFYDIVRMDALAVFFAILTLYIALYHRRGFLFAAIVGAFAYFTKQQMVFILPAVAIGLATRNKKHAALFSLLSIALIVVGTIAFNTATEGWYRFFTFTIPSVKAAQGFSLQTALEFVPKYLFGSLGFFTLILILATVRLRSTIGVSNWVFLIAAYIAAVGSAAVGLGNPGGYKNVLMPLLGIIAIVFPLCVEAIEQMVPRQPQVAPVILLLGFLSLVFNPLGEKMLLASARQREAGDAFIAKLHSMTGDVWVPFHGYLNTLAGKPEHVHFMAMNDALVPKNAASKAFQREIDSALAAHRFSAIILDEERVFHWDSVPHYSRSSSIFQVPNVGLSRIGDAATRPQFIYRPAP